jgi:MFS family permease
MNDLARRIQRTYLTLLLGNTLAASFIWGINTLFLLDAGLSNFEAFAANAFFTGGMMLFEIPTGVVADTWGRRVSYLLGTIALAASTLLYYLLWVAEAPFWEWAVVSMLLGLGFTFFSGAVEAWLVDALHFAGYEGGLESVLGRGQMIMGVAMLGGSVAGGVIAQATSLGVPFLMRVGVLLVMFAVAWRLMRDLGFTPAESASPLRATKTVFDASLQYGLKNPPVRWMMLAAPFSGGVGIYTFYALQPYLLELYGDPNAYSVAGLAAAIVAGSQILGGYAAPRIRRLFDKRTTSLILGALVSAAILALLALVGSFWLALALLVVWGLVFAADMPIRQAYLNDMIPSQQRATVLSFDSLMNSSGGVVIQPALGKAADATSYGTSFAFGALFQLLAVPFLLRSRREGAPADRAVSLAEVTEPPEATAATPVGELADREQVDDEDERLVRRDHAARSPSAVGHGGRDRQLAPAADLHALHARVPAGDDLALPELELEGLSAVPGRVELLAGREGNSNVVHRDLRAAGGLVAIADGEVLDAQLEGDVPLWFIDLGLVDLRAFG